MMRELTSLVLLAGCDGVFGLDPLTTCASGDPFSERTAVPINGTYSVEAARFTPTQSLGYLSLCPASGNKAECEIYSSPYLEGAFTAITKLPGVSTPGGYDAYPTITPDGRFLLWGAERGGLDVAVYVATAINGSFDAPDIVRLDVIPNQRYSNEPYLLGDNRTLYLAGDDDSSTSWDLWRAHGEAPTFGGTATPVPGVNTTSLEFAPVSTDDEHEIFFASNRLTPSDDTALDIFTATRTSSTATFETPTRVDSLSTAGIDWPLWLSPDACQLYYINKTDNVATLFVARR